MRTATLTDSDGVEITYDCYDPAGSPRGVLHVLHGWAEHAGRYSRFADAAAAEGLVVYVDDHRGHGRTGVAAGRVGDLGPRGMEGVLDAAHAVTQRAATEHSGLPLLVLGHSWGSFIGQHYAVRWGNELAGLILTGTTLRRGQARSGSLNDRFEPAATPYDWLTRDSAEVQKYIDDPWCGFETMSAGRPSPLAEPDFSRVPPALPIFVVNGADDPIGGAEGGAALAEKYREVGVKDVTFKAYPGGRHELLNELNRDEVTADLLGWLVEHLVANPAA
jgi:alpha-beta hydrolase superfamily lysophospholipase